MKIVSIFLTTIIFGFILPMHAEETSPTPRLTEEQAIEILNKIDAFGFGPARGERERTSDTAFQALLSCPKAKEKFTSLFEKGGTPSKLFALYALRSIDPPAFDKLSKSMKPDEMIFTRFGCVVDKIKVSEVVNEISKGNYGGYFKPVNP